MSQGGAAQGVYFVVGPLCLMVSAVPLIYLPGLYAFVWAPKHLVLNFCIALTCLGWIVHILRLRRVSLVSTPLFLPLICFLGVAVLSAPGSTHPLDTLTELSKNAALVVLLVVVANSLSLEQIRPILWASSATGLVVGMVGVLQYHGLAVSWIPSAAPPSATFGNRNFAAEYLICAIPLSILLFLTSSRKTPVLLSGLSTTLMGVFLIYTRTRSAWVGAGGAVLLVGGLLSAMPGLRRSIFEALSSEINRRKSVLAFGFLFLFIVLSLLPPQRSIEAKLSPSKADVLTTARSILQRDVGVDYRFSTWRATLRMIADHPLLGVGPGGWKRAYPHYDRGVTNTPGMVMNNLHNDYLWIASENGLIGLGTYLWFLFAGFLCLFRMARDPEKLTRVAALMFSLSLLAYLGDAFLNFPRDWPHAAMFPHLILGVAAASTSQRQIEIRSRTNGLLLVVVLLLVPLCAGTLSWRWVWFDRHYLMANYWGKTRTEWPTLLAETQRALEYGSFRPHILVLKGDALKHLERPREAEAAYREALSLAPYHWQAHESLGSLFLQQGRIEEAMDHCRKVLALCPSSTDSRNNLGVIFLERGDMDRAAEEFQKVLNVDAEDAGVHFNLGNTYLAQERFGDAVEEYLEVFRIDPGFRKAHLNIAVAYQKKGDYQEAIENYLRIAEIEPENASVHWGLGLALEKLGKLKDAEGAFRKAISLQPGISEVHLSLGNFLYTQRRYQDAIEAYRSYLEVAQGDKTQLQFVKDRIEVCKGRIKELGV